MSNFWQPTSSTPPHNWSNSTSKEWDTMPHKAEWFHGFTHHQTPSNDKHRKMMRLKLRDLYDVLHPNCAGKSTAKVL